MSKIAIACATRTDNLLATKILHDEIGFSFSSAKARLGMGKRGVFFTTELFLNDHVEKDKLIRTLLQRFKSIGVELFISEIGYADEWAEVKDFDSIRISDEDMISELDSAKGSFQ